MNARLSIAIHAPTFLPKCSGAEIFHHNLAQRLTERGHRVTAVVPRGAVRALARRGVRLAYPLEPYPAHLWSWVDRWPRLGFQLNRLALARLQARHRFDVWHGAVTYPTGACLIDWGGGWDRVPCLVRSVGDDVLTDESRQVGLVTDARVARILRTRLPRARLIVAQSRSMRRAYESLGVPPERIVVLPNAVDLDRFVAPPDRAALRRRLGWPERDFVFLVVGRNHPQKDYPTLLAAVARLRAETGPGRFRLVAAGRDLGGMQDEIRSRGLTDVVHLIEVGIEGSAPDGFRLPPEGMVRLYGAADAFVLSSRLEGFSSALLEALASGLPAVVTDGPGCADWVEDAGCALVVPVGDDTAMARAMKRLLEDECLRTACATAARRWASRFNWPELVERYEQLYRSLLDRPARPGTPGSTARPCP